MKKKVLALFLALCLALALLPAPALAAPAEDDSVRYIVLVLDVSGSMSGTPMTEAKEAAAAFCSSLTTASGENHVAIVAYSSSSSIKHYFTTSSSELAACVNGLSAPSGGTNTNAALVSAKSLLDSVTDTDVKKSVVLLSDGLPQTGDTLSTGRYTSADYASYSYANKAYSSATDMKLHCTIYTLGFFHSLTGTQLTFGRKFMKDLASTESDYYEVTDGAQLGFSFGDIADDIVSTVDKDPIIVIPGIMGSRLFTSGTTFNDSTRVWDPSADLSGLSRLEAKIQGTLYVRPCENQHNYTDGGSADNYGREYGAQDT